MPCREPDCGRAREELREAQESVVNLRAMVIAWERDLDRVGAERDQARKERDTLRATLVRWDHDLSGLRGDLDLARDLCEAVERWTGHGPYPEDAVLIGDIREAAAVLRDALKEK